MRESSESKPKTKTQSRDAISPDMGKDEVRRNLPGTNADSYDMEGSKAYVYGWTADPNKGQSARCLFSYCGNDLSQWTKRFSPTEARALAAMLISAAYIAEGGTHQVRAWYDLIASNPIMKIEE